MGFQYDRTEFFESLNLLNGQPNSFDGQALSLEANSYFARKDSRLSAEPEVLDFSISGGGGNQPIDNVIMIDAVAPNSPTLIRQTRVEIGPEGVYVGRAQTDPDNALVSRQQVILTMEDGKLMMTANPEAKNPTYIKSGNSWVELKPGQKVQITAASDVRFVNPSLTSPQFRIRERVGQLMVGSQTVEVFRGGQVVTGADNPALPKAAKIKLYVENGKTYVANMNPNVPVFYDSKPIGNLTVPLENAKLLRFGGPEGKPLAISTLPIDYKEGNAILGKDRPQDRIVKESEAPRTGQVKINGQTIDVPVNGARIGRGSPGLEWLPPYVSREQVELSFNEKGELRVRDVSKTWSGQADHMAFIQDAKGNKTPMPKDAPYTLQPGDRIIIGQEYQTPLDMEIIANKPEQVEPQKQQSKVVDRNEPRPMQTYLVSGRQIDSAGINIGRNDVVSFSKDLRYISKEQATLSQTVDGKLMIKASSDQTAKPTFVNGERLGRGEEREIKPTDKITFLSAQGPAVELKPDYVLTPSEADVLKTALAKVGRGNNLQNIEQLKGVIPGSYNTNAVGLNSQEQVALLKFENSLKNELTADGAMKFAREALVSQKIISPEGAYTVSPAERNLLNAAFDKIAVRYNLYDANDVRMALNGAIDGKIKLTEEQKRAVERFKAALESESRGASVSDYLRELTSKVEYKVMSNESWTLKTAFRKIQKKYPSIFEGRPGLASDLRFASLDSSLNLNWDERRALERLIGALENEKTKDVAQKEFEKLQPRKQKLVPAGEIVLQPLSGRNTDNAQFNESLAKLEIRSDGKIVEKVNGKERVLGDAEVKQKVEEVLEQKLKEARKAGDKELEQLILEEMKASRQTGRVPERMRRAIDEARSKGGTAVGLLFVISYALDAYLSERRKSQQ